MNTENVLTVGCRFTGHKASMRAGFSKSGEEIPLDPTPWKPFFEPAIKHYPLFRWIGYTVKIGLSIEIRFKLTGSIARNLINEVGNYFDQTVLRSDVLEIHGPGIKSRNPEIIRDDFVYNKNGNGRPMTKWALRFWEFIESIEKEYPIVLEYQDGIFVATGGYDRELLPEFAREIIDKQR